MAGLSKHHMPPHVFPSGFVGPSQQSQTSRDKDGRRCDDRHAEDHGVRLRAEVRGDRSRQGIHQSTDAMLTPGVPYNDGLSAGFAIKAWCWRDRRQSPGPALLTLWSVTVDSRTLSVSREPGRSESLFGEEEGGVIVGQDRAIWHRRVTASWQAWGKNQRYRHGQSRADGLRRGSGFGVKRQPYLWKG
ncbi:hypothetical protein DPEC_G00313930 [Dallia pectoralis]|uniref:Uncharacterized protein n=1 Tax=Dallia pectoralis TaxID=75939 RepID=A0ACC2FCA0_DALPE|nr:hypothetical protein DPEC_G00313930 [Dallia pectoralis]